MIDLPPFEQVKSGLLVPSRPAIIRRGELIKPVLPAGIMVVNGWLQQSAASSPPSFVANGAIAGSASTTSLAVSFPASVAADAIALLWSMGYEDMTFPGSFTAEAQVQDVSSATKFRLGWKRCSGSEGGTSVNITQSSNQMWAQIAVFTGCVVSGTPYEGYSAVTGTSNTATLTTPAIVSTVDQTLGVLIALDNGNVTFTAASGYTERLDNSSTEGIDGSFAVDTIVKAAAGTTSAGTKTASAATFSGYAIFGLALKPA